MRTIPIRQSLHKHTTVLGAERDLVMLSALVSLLVGIGGMTLIAGSAAVVFWACAVFFLRLMAKADPLLSKVWFRHIKQQDCYPARSSVWRQIGVFRC
jgi:type IV secretion system protein VirB3/type IV secretion system protein VirB4